MDSFVSEFLAETSENLSTLDEALLDLERNPNDPGLLQNIFRLMHTIKGTCSFFSFPRLESVAHAAEDVLGRIRDGELEVTAEVVTLILQSIDRIRMILGHLEQEDGEPEGKDEELIMALAAAARGYPVSAAAVPAVSDNDEPGVVTDEEHGRAEAVAFSAGDAQEVLQGFMSMAGMPTSRSPCVPSTAVMVPAPSLSGGEVVPLQKEGDHCAVPPSIRVSVDLLENVMTMVSELVLTRNQLLQMIRGRSDSEFSSPFQRLSHITTAIQEGVMKTRMQPIGSAWAKIPRIVRDLALEMNKKIDLQMLGTETELDRQVLELIRDPLIHMVRNSVDHGLEGPDERRAAGKPETGNIVLKAYHEGAHIIVEIADDGRGLDIDGIRARAIANGMANEAETALMNEQQIARYILEAGLSTAEKVTSLSGRGVGMDVVRANIEKIGGSISMTTSPGKGARFIINIPLTLAIVSALIVECGGERFAIPQICVLELVRVTSTSEHRIETINNAPVLRRRDRRLPLLSLRELLALSDKNGNVTETFIVVVQVGTSSFGLIVDKVFDIEEIVVRPLASILRNIPIFSGNTTLGDGGVVMILDPNGIADKAGPLGLDSLRPIEESAMDEQDIEGRILLLVFRSGTAALKAVPLARVTRLEEIDMSRIEYSQGKPMIQYRGHLMPLASIDGSLPRYREGNQPVLVFSDPRQDMGLLVDEIIDIVEGRLKSELSAERPGLIGTAVIAGTAMDIIDAGHYLTQGHGDGSGAAVNGACGSDPFLRKRILLVDDSPFFRHVLTPVLAAAGYEVAAVDSPEKALEMRDAGDKFDLIISDIEMPTMNGFDFATCVRGNELWQNVPMLAISSQAVGKDFERGRRVGFTDYVTKFDREALLRTIARTLAARDAV